ncbi:MAG TPA: O-antigen ligase family protein [Sporichthya sp.]|nr:O-antigen ligase family protein [Sporichthya sp.]
MTDTPLARTTWTAWTTYDQVGAALLAAFLGWAWVSALVNHTTAWPLTALLITVAAVYAAGRSRADRLDAVVLGFTICLLVLVVIRPASVSGRPLAPPLHYGNADGALFALGVAAAAIAAVRATPAQRLLRWTATGGLVLITFATTSRAAAALALAIVAVAPLAGRAAVRRWCAAIGLAAVAVAAVIVVAWAAGHPPLEASRAESALSSRRVQLWSEADDLIRAEPLFGVGPGRFSVESPTAARFPSTSETHSEYLQVAAETGIPGAALLAALVGWVFGALHRSRRDPRAVVIATAAAASLGIQGAIDYVWHFPAIMVVGAALLGVTTAISGPRAAATNPKGRRTGP